jgi:hypothetical protein
MGVVDSTKAQCVGRGSLDLRARRFGRTAAQRGLVATCAPWVVFVAIEAHYRHLPLTESQPCESTSIDRRDWARVRVADAPVTLLAPPLSRRSHLIAGPLDRQAWTIGRSTLNMSVEEDSTQLPHRYSEAPQASDLAREGVRRCVVMLGTRALHITTYRSEAMNLPYGVDGVLPLVRRNGNPSWLLFAAESPNQPGQDTVLAAMLSLRLDSANAESSHASTPCPPTPPASDEGTWIWHRLHFAPLQVLSPPEWTWVYKPEEHVEGWFRHSPELGPYAVETFNYDVRQMPTWQILTAEPPYALVCWTKVAGRRGDVVIDTLLSLHSVPRLATNYRAFAYVRIGPESVLRVAAQISDDAAPPSVFLRTLSHLRQDSVFRQK